MKRQAATTRGLTRRIDDLDIGQVVDPRNKDLVDHPLPVILTSTITAMVTDAPGLRGVESRTEQIATGNDRWHGITERIADNTVGAVLRRLDPLSSGPMPAPHGQG